MNDYRLQMAEDRSQSLADYSDWVDANADDLLYAYVDQLTDFPDEIYEGVLDDDYPDAEDAYASGLTINDVDNDWLSDQYENHLQNAYDDARGEQ